MPTIPMELLIAAFAMLPFGAAMDFFDFNSSDDDDTGDEIDEPVEVVEPDAESPLSLLGTDGDDELYGLGGDDTLDAGAGADRLDGDAGDDLLNGRDGNDTLIGGTGSDLLTGGAGNDLVNGGTDDGSPDSDYDRLYGSDGDDTLIVGDSDVASGGAGADEFEVYGDVWIDDFDPDADLLVFTAPPGETLEVESQTVANNTLVIALNDGSQITLSNLTNPLEAGSFRFEEEEIV
ncbi:calcium-binding protein [Litorisediminicola beolgyonensis]|uniref:Calcium-binding protein n=1 Tax=Litorisediminicola beolgyonensis TaxID=1173614 RepID=A0ABW3ZEP4_9RHOB